MARCKECIHGECCSVLVPIRTTLCNDNADKMCELFKSTADVIPKEFLTRKEDEAYELGYKEAKSEAEELIGENESLAKTVNEASELIRKLRSKVEKSKTEVASKIFEEIERFLYMHFRFCKEESGNDDTKYLEGRLELNTQMQEFIAKLKKEICGG